MLVWENRLTTVTWGDLQGTLEELVVNCDEEMEEELVVNCVVAGDL